MSIKISLAIKVMSFSNLLDTIPQALPKHYGSHRRFPPGPLSLTHGYVPAPISGQHPLLNHRPDLPKPDRLPVDILYSYCSPRPNSSGLSLVLQHNTKSKLPSQLPHLLWTSQAITLLNSLV